MITSIDLFAGGGGASEGIRRATGRAPIVAVNHDPAAIQMHAANHPGTMHLCENVFDVDPFAPRGQLDLLWASPDCTHFSRAKGGKPVSKNIRSLAWVVHNWAKHAMPSVICIENVPEFQGWGPLDANGKPIKSKRGETFKQFVRALEEAGYDVEWRELVACDYGAPTSRKRLFLIARSDGQDIVWPEPTHGPGRSHSYRTAAECIDWEVPALSIFATPAEAKAWAKQHGCGIPRRPLAEATMRRIFEGVRRYVIEAADPFVLNLTHGGRVESLHEPFRTITGANRGEKALITPHLATLDHQSSAPGSCVTRMTDPVSTITTKNRHLLVSPTLIQTGYGERKGQRPRALDLHAPLGTIVSCGGGKHALVSAFFTKYYGHATRARVSAVVVTSASSRSGARSTPSWTSRCACSPPASSPGPKASATSTC
jgi:DNA (cytosine-5)-methyltransferase 1